MVLNTAVSEYSVLLKQEYTGHFQLNLKNALCEIIINIIRDLLMSVLVSVCEIYVLVRLSEYGTS